MRRRVVVHVSQSVWPIGSDMPECLHDAMDMIFATSPCPIASVKFSSSRDVPDGELYRIGANTNVPHGIVRDAVDAVLVVWKGEAA